MCHAHSCSYNGVIVKPEHYGQVSPGDFHQMLTASLTAWKSDGKRGVWLTILIGQSELIPMAAKVSSRVSSRQLKG